MIISFLYSSVDINVCEGVILDLNVVKKVKVNPLLKIDSARKVVDKNGICIDKYAVNVNVHGFADNQMGINICKLVNGGTILQQVSDIWDATETNLSVKKTKGFNLNLNIISRVDKYVFIILYLFK